ncbi:uncharacterized protein LOC127093960 [Lathyrus oleraceus]|uniref:uncharacterized protein LOC127093960 n=1 Tax=Pisum sativum TaxID=3888 RepID=UPI0021D27648|nr:uncharacterized protein LOC127093960 [Pisum sativum]
MSRQRTSTDPQNAQPIVDMADAIQAIHAMATAIAQQSATTIQQAGTFAQQAAIRAQREALRDQREEVVTAARDLTSFNRQNPQKFKGEHDPDKVEYATFLLRAEAESWWQGAKQLMESNNEALNWVTFKQKFMDKYFPSSARSEKEAQFLGLYQGNMTISEYADKFDSLAKYFCYFRDHVDENYKCEKFEQGLRYEIKESVEPLEIRQFQGHVSTQCPERARVCYLCQRPRHFARDCRAPRRDHVPSTNNNNDDIHPTAKGRAYNIRGEEASNSSGLIQGECEIADKLFLTLFDSGATHSFISVECVNSVQLLVTSLPFDLVVTIPSSEPVILNEACLQCPLTILGMKFKADLICISLKHLRVILGMDWLSSHHVLLDCARKSLIFLDPDVSRFLNSNRLKISLKGGIQKYVFLNSVSMKLEVEINEIQVVRDFPKYFH